MAVACLVANIAFFYALIKDVTRGHSNSRSSLSAKGRASTAVTNHSDVISKTDSMQFSMKDSLDWVESAETRQMSWDTIEYARSKDTADDGGWKPI
jgi:hypothetical protein